MKKKSAAPLVAMALLSLLFLLPSWKNARSTQREFYRLTVYHFSSPAQEKRLDSFFQNALVPALHRAGISRVGVFKSWANDTLADKLMFVLLPVPKLTRLINLEDQLKKDRLYTAAGTGFLNADPKNAPFSRMETIVLRAFPGAPHMHLPSLQSPKPDRVYELRSYESATQSKFESKVKMFNEGNEIAIFNRLQFNPVFYSEVVAGSRMPNLMYMTSFENRADRDAHWKKFSADSVWKRLSALPEYQGNVSHIDINFLYATDYSDF